MREQLIVLYTMQSCPFCAMMKTELNSLGIDFIERDIDDEEEEYDLFVQAVDGNEYVPAIMIVEFDGEQHSAKFFAPERDFNEISDGVQIIRDEISKFQTKTQN